MTTVVLVDDDALVRMALRSVLSRFGDVEVIGEFADAGAALRLIEQRRTDVLLLDIHLEHISGFAAVPAIRYRSPGTRIVMMTSFSPERSEDHVRRAGVDGFFSKNASAQTIVDIVLGRQDEAPSRKPGSPRMSPREREVGELVAEGQSNEQIAAALDVSINTVKTYVSRLFVKFGVINRVQLSNAINEVRTRTGRPPTP